MNLLKFIKMNNLEKISKIIYSNDLFALNFAPYEPLIFPLDKKMRMYETEQRFSEYEIERLLEKYETFRKQSKFVLKKKTKTDHQAAGHDILLNSNYVGFIEKKKDYFRLGFCLVAEEEEAGFKWHYYVHQFLTLEDVKKYLKLYYPMIQNKYRFYIETPEDDGDWNLPESVFGPNNEERVDDEYTF